MRKLTIGLAASALLGAALGGSQAADLPLKAPAAVVTPLCTPASCTIWYAGINVEGVGTNFNIIGQGLNNSIAAAGSGIGGQAGVQFWNGQYFAGAKVSLDYDMDPPSVGAATTGRLHSMEVVQLGGNVLGLLGITNPTPPPNPTAVQAFLAMLTSPYLNFGYDQMQGRSAGFVSGAGLQYAICSRCTLNLDYYNIQRGTGSGAVPIAALPTTTAAAGAVENRVMLSFNYAFSGPLF